MRGSTWVCARFGAALVGAALFACGGQTASHPSVDAAAPDAVSSEHLSDTAGNDLPLGDSSPSSEVIGGALDTTCCSDSRADGASTVDAGETELPDTKVAATDATGDVLVDGTPSPDATTDATTDGYGQGDAADAADGADGADTADAVCQDKRYRKDGKIPNDTCWGPPAHYCSAKWEAAVLWYGCAGMAGPCCLVFSSCRPCGWQQCPIVAQWAEKPTTLPPGCPNYFLDDNKPYVPPAVCLPFIPPDAGSEICWDGVPSEWHSPSFHELDSE